jgi:hypothetical protein
MSTKRIPLFASLIVFLILASISIPAGAAEYAQKLTWAEASYIVDKNVRIVMPDGAVLEGMAQAFNSEGFVLDVRKTNGASDYRKGSLTVPRTSLKTLQIGDSTIRWRVTGVAVGTGIGVVTAVLGSIATSDNYILGTPNKGKAVGLFGAAIALPVGGYLLGKKADQHWTTIVLVDR